MTALLACICGALAVTILVPLALLLLRLLGAAQWRDFYAACKLALAAWFVVAVLWLAGVR